MLSTIEILFIMKKFICIAIAFSLIFTISVSCYAHELEIVGFDLIEEPGSDLIIGLKLKLYFNDGSEENAIIKDFNMTNGEDSPEMSSWIGTAITETREFDFSVYVYRDYIKQCFDPVKKIVYVISGIEKEYNDCFVYSSYWFMNSVVKGTSAYIKTITQSSVPGVIFDGNTSAENIDFITILALKSYVPLPPFENSLSETEMLVIMNGIFLCNNIDLSLSSRYNASLKSFRISNLPPSIENYGEIVSYAKQSNDTMKYIVKYNDVNDSFFRLSFTVNRNNQIVRIERNTYTSGDVNCDKKVSLEDAMLIFMHVSGKTVLTGISYTEAKITGGADITLADAMTLFMIVAGK
ncbi:MAG: hypothetical protein DBX47_06640 [Clostridiales bacterium]|nr:MAG: hypothetical protein DBX47_06640 [Clostridiales bacterium]